MPPGLGCEEPAAGGVPAAATRQEAAALQAAAAAAPKGPWSADGQLRARRTHALRAKQGRGGEEEESAVLPSRQPRVAAAAQQRLQLQQRDVVSAFGPMRLRLAIVLQPARVPHAPAAARLAWLA